MQYRALACDYDGTLATHGVVDADRLLLMATGRELPELKAIFPELSMFHLVVADNGALLYDPAREQETPLATAPPATFVPELTACCFAPIARGRAIVATWEPHEAVVLIVIHDQQLELQVRFNQGAAIRNTCASYQKPVCLEHKTRASWAADDCGAPASEPRRINIVLDSCREQNKAGQTSMSAPPRFFPSFAVTSGE